jgi:condensin complex subunit 1
MAEQAVNTIYTLGDQPDALCSDILRQMTTRVFGPRSASAPTTPKIPTDDSGAEEEEEAEDVRTETMDQDETINEEGEERSTGNAFELSQLVFVAGHCSIKQLVHLELVERDLKRLKAEETSKLKSAGGKKVAQDDELDQVAGSVEDEIGDTIQLAREKELMYGPNSLLRVFGPMAASIVSQPKLYRVSQAHSPYLGGKPLINPVE